jgi:hypothetical protein
MFREYRNTLNHYLDHKYYIYDLSAIQAKQAYLYKTLLLEPL